MRRCRRLPLSKCVRKAAKLNNCGRSCLGGTLRRAFACSGQARNRSRALPEPIYEMASCYRLFAGPAPRDDDKRLSTVHNGGMIPEKTVGRLNTYASTQGYVYQYYFVGERAALANEPEAPATEFVFDVTSDRKLTYAVSVFLPQGPLAEWNAAHGRPLNDAEQYAAVKMRLFRGFDEIEDVKA